MKINPNLVLTFVYYQGTLDYCSTCLKDHPEQDNPDKEHSYCPVYKVNSMKIRNCNTRKQILKRFDLVIIYRRIKGKDLRLT